MAAPYLPLRWKSIGNQWWFALPIDWAAANGHYDLVRELLRIDTNLLIKLASLRRIRRLESVWDNESHPNAARCRSLVARNLLHDFEKRKGKNSLIRAGYGGWLLYTAASAGDLNFVLELLQRCPLLVFGEGEYGVTDILYAAARSKTSDVFRLLFAYAILPSWPLDGGATEAEVQSGVVPSVFKWEMINRAVHAAARGGNLEILREFIGEGSDVLAYRDVRGSTLLHAASAAGQVEVVKALVRSFDLTTTRDDDGNTSLHIAAYSAHLAVVEALIAANPSSIVLTNCAGNTFFHNAVAGFHSFGFRRLDLQIEFITKLLHNNSINLEEIINMTNNDGQTSLHMAVTGNIQSELFEILISIPSINLNVCDVDGMTPLALLNQRPRSPLSVVLTGKLMSAGGVSQSQDHMASVVYPQVHRAGSSPGTSFRIPDPEIFLYADDENLSDVYGDGGNGKLTPLACTCEHSQTETLNSDLSEAKIQSISDDYATRQLKFLLRWRPQSEANQFTENSFRWSSEKGLLDVHWKFSSLENMPTPLRQKSSKLCALPNNKRTLSIRSFCSSPSSKKKFAASLRHGVVQTVLDVASPYKSASGSVKKTGETKSIDKNKSTGDKLNFPSNRLMNQYFSFGTQGLSVGDLISEHYMQSVLSAS